MRIAPGSDHAGFDPKEMLKVRLMERGDKIADRGCYTAEPADYPEFTLKVGWQLVSGRCERGIVACGNGFAVARLANRIPGIRAAVCHDAFTARTSKEMGNSNIISIGTRVVGPDLAWDLTQIWLRSAFLGNTVQRYARRLEQGAAVEQRFADPRWPIALEAYVGQLGDPSEGGEAANA
jgi:ribose 5-phosphate isomerase B